MNNPILQMLNAPRQNNIQNILGMINGNPEAYFNQLMRTNTQFAQFVQQNKGKTVEQIAKENNVDLSAIQNMIR